MIIAGIGSRKTPLEIARLMTSAAAWMSSQNWRLRSGGATGADSAWESGWKGSGEIFLPFDGFNGKNVGERGGLQYIVPDFNADLIRLAARIHPNWAACNPLARKLHARNGCQVLGQDLKSPASAIICWTVNGGGGTAQALRIARANGIPILDLNTSGPRKALWAFCQKLGAG